VTFSSLHSLSTLNILVFLYIVFPPQIPEVSEHLFFTQATCCNEQIKDDALMVKFYMGVVRFRTLLF
jgi:hypothetical protein